MGGGGERVVKSFAILPPNLRCCVLTYVYTASTRLMFSRSDDISLQRSTRSTTEKQPFELFGIDSFAVDMDSFAVEKGLACTPLWLTWTPLRLVEHDPSLVFRVKS